MDQFYNDISADTSHLLPNTSTFIIKGRKRALKEAYSRSLDVTHCYFAITGGELVKSYMPLFKHQVFNRSDSSYIITNIEKETIYAVKDLTAAGAEVKHIDLLALRVGSTEQSVVQSTKKHFLSDWKTAIPATQRIREIEEGNL